MTSCVYIVGLGDRSERNGRKRWVREEKIEREEEQRKKMGENVKGYTCASE